MKKFILGLLIGSVIGLGAVYHTNHLPQAVAPTPQPTLAVSSTPSTLKVTNQAGAGTNMLGEDLQPAAGSEALNWKLGK